MSYILHSLFLWIGFQHALASDLHPVDVARQNTSAAQGEVTPLALDPTTVCKALLPEGLHARSGYKGSPGSSYRCASQRKSLNAGGGKVHEIRFYATGEANSVNLLAMELSVHSKQDMQRAHRLLKEYAAALTQRTLSMALPDEVADAIMGAVSGRWSVADRQFSLRRTSLPYWGHELLLVIR